MCSPCRWATADFGSAWLSGAAVAEKPPPHPGCERPQAILRAMVGKKAVCGGLDRARRCPCAPDASQLRA
eukprot:2498047-Pyramimonas_sp.AAC.1